MKPYTIDDNIEELKKLSTGEITSFDRIIDNHDDVDCYFLCGAGIIIHSVRSPYAYLLDRRSSPPAVFEFYDVNGHFMGEKSKRYTPSYQWSLQLDEKIRNSDFVRLSNKPSFIALRNVHYKTRTNMCLTPN